MSICATAPLLLGLVRLHRFQAATRRLWHQPLSADERTAILLQAVDADTADVDANAHGTITPRQWRRIHAETGTLGLINGPLPVVQVVEGPVVLSAHQLRNWIWYDLTMNGIRFRSTTSTIVNAMQPHTLYRVYFIDLPTRNQLQGITRIMVSGVAVPPSP